MLIQLCEMPGMPTYRSLLHCDCIFCIIGKYSCPFTSFINHTVLITTVRILHPVAQITLHDAEKQNNDEDNDILLCPDLTALNTDQEKHLQNL